MRTNCVDAFTALVYRCSTLAILEVTVEKRVRSPNYPAMSLKEAVQRAGEVHTNQHTHGAPREVVAKSMGYNSLNGASATAISALIKYGLLEGRAEDIKISDRAMRILHPQSSQEKAEAVREAALAPELFKELAERFPGRTPADELLRSYLIRNGFASAAVSSVIRSYRETNEFVEEVAGAYDSSNQEPGLGDPSMQTASDTSASAGMKQDNNTLLLKGNERSIVSYSFEGGGVLRIIVGGDIDTEEALEMAETQIAIKRKELQLRAARAAKASSAIEKKGGKDDLDA